MAAGGRLIALEGIEGSGKSTQLALLAADLSAAGLEVVLTREPGGTAAGEAIRAVLLSTASRTMTPLADLLLYNAARAQLLHEVVEPAVAAGHVVLCDRYKDATRAYQGHAGGLAPEVVEQVHTLSGLKREADLTLLLDLPVEIGLARARRRQQGASDHLGRFEGLDDAFHERVRRGYLALAAASPGRIAVVDARGSVEEVHSRLREAAFSRLGLEQ
jgi:dTMP kinase